MISSLQELRGEEAIRRRTEMLGLPRIAPLSAYVTELREAGRGRVLNFDPLDGGIDARVLFLFETPSPKAAVTGFMSRDNPDPTARAVARYMAEAGLPRESTCLWTIVPWSDGSWAVSAAAMRAGLGALKGLLEVLQDVRAIVLVGRRMWRAERLLDDHARPVFTSLHPSLIVQNRFPDKAASIPLAWAQARDFIG